MSPDNPHILYVSTESPISGKGGEVFRSMDGGEEWSKIDQNKSYKSLALYNDDPSDIIGCTIDRLVLHSSDRGSTWVNVTSNLPFLEFSLIDTAISGENTF